MEASAAGAGAADPYFPIYISSDEEEEGHAYYSPEEVPIYISSDEEDGHAYYSPEEVEIQEAILLSLDTSRAQTETATACAASSSSHPAAGAASTPKADTFSAPSETPLDSKGKRKLQLEDDPGHGAKAKRRSKRNRFNCAICFERVQAAEKFVVSHCAHAFCNSCVGRYVSGKVAENVAAIGCPDPACETGVTEMDLCRDIIPLELFDRWNAVLCEELFYCSLCMEMVHTHIDGCTHTFCTSCVSQYIAAKVEENVLAIGCPDPECKDGVLHPDACRDVIPAQVFQRWGAALCDSSLGSLKFYCPFKECSALLVDDPGQGEAVITNVECPHCCRMLCAQCKVPWHDGVTCAEFQQLGKDERSNSDLLLRKLAQRRKWQRCPKCKIFVVRVEGCVYIVCRCGYRFCYLCASPMSKGNHHCSRCKRT